MELPRYCIVGDRPVKAVATDDGGMDILAFDWKTGEFVREMDYLSQVVMSQGGEVDVVTKEEFDKKVATLRAKLKK